MANRVVITGLGIVSPIGSTVERFWNGMLYGESQPEQYPYGDNHRFYWVRDHDSSGASASVAPISRATDFAMRAAEMALEDAGLQRERSDHVIGVSVGTAMGESDRLSDERSGGASVDPLEMCFFRVAAALADQFQLTGPNLSFSTACAASSYSLSLARDAILDGWADVMVVGGTEAFSRVAVSCLNRIGALDPVVCRPFDAMRAGTVLGEGAAVLILESEAHARQRGHQHMYAEIKSCGWSCDGYHATAPEPTGQQIELSMRRALTEANLAPGDIDCVLPHGTGTELNDLVESVCLERLFGPTLENLLICAVKSKTGHTSGGAGIISSLTAALMIDRGVVPPSANIEAVDPRCHLRMHREAPITTPIRNVLVNSYGFGGNNISLVLGRV
jgi:3-oxoacyl-(acyl-carrier-protein) synthase